MNRLAPDKREKACEMLAGGMSIRAVADALEVHRNTIHSLSQHALASRQPKPPQKESLGKGEDEFASMPLKKSRRQYLRLKASGHFLKNNCKDCRAPCINQRCYQCWRRTAALKRLDRELGPDHPEYMERVVEIFGTTYTHPSKQ